MVTVPPQRLRRNEAYHTTVLDTPSYPSRQRKEESGKTSRTLESKEDLPTTDNPAPTL
jgi:hypothetical protein